MQGFWDGEVTTLGRAQIRALAERFETVPVDAVYASDLSRAVLTAEAAAGHGKIPIRTKKALRELNVGPWEQRFFGNVSRETPELADLFLNDAEHWYLEGAETFADVRDRALPALKAIAEENEGRTVAVVSHGATIRCILWGITGWPLNDTEKLPIFRNTAVSKLRWDGQRFIIEYLNDSSHLLPAQQTSWNATADLWDEPLDPADDRAYYTQCYRDAWLASHGDLKYYREDAYFEAARQHHRDNPGAVLRLSHGEEPVGLVDLDPKRAAECDAGWISLLFLKESFRNRGYGIQLLARAVLFYRDLGRRSLRLHVAEENEMARAFYRREGFSVIGEQQAQAGRLLLMECPLRK